MPIVMKMAPPKMTPPAYPQFRIPSTIAPVEMWEVPV